VVSDKKKRAKQKEELRKIEGEKKQIKQRMESRSEGSCITVNWKKYKGNLGASYEALNIIERILLRPIITERLRKDLGYIRERIELGISSHFTSEKEIEYLRKYIQVIQ
jgi:hypothetical protein